MGKVRLMSLKNLLGNWNENKYFMLFLAVIGSIILCALGMWVEAMIYAFATFMLTIAMFLKLV